MTRTLDNDMLAQNPLLFQNVAMGVGCFNTLYLSLCVIVIDDDPDSGQAENSKKRRNKAAQTDRSHNVNVGEIQGIVPRHFSLILVSSLSET